MAEHEGMAQQQEAKIFKFYRTAEFQRSIDRMERHRQERQCGSAGCVVIQRERNNNAKDNNVIDDVQASE